MKVMRIICRVIGFLLLAAAVIALLIDVAPVLEGEAVRLSPLGAFWYDLHPASINLIQAVVERYIWADLWRFVMLPMLQLPAFVWFAILGTLAVVLCRRGRERFLHKRT